MGLTRLAYITHQRLPSDDTSAIQLVQTVAALGRRGADIELHFPVRGRPAAKDARGWRELLESRYDVVIPCALVPLAMDGTPVPWEKLLHARRAVRHAKADGRWVYTRDQWPAAFALRGGVPLLFETYRLLGGLPPFRRRVVHWIATHPLCLGLITHSEFARQSYLREGVPPERVRAIYNGFDPKAFAVPRSSWEARRALGLPDAPTASYAGRIAAGKRVDLLLEAAARAPTVQWLIAGDTGSAEARPMVARAAGLRNVHFPGYLRGERLALALQAGDLLVIPPSAEPLERYGQTVMPIKVFQYLAAGRPIVCGAVPDTEELLQDDVNAVRIPPDDAGALASAVTALAADPGRRARLGAAARDLARSLTWDARAERILGWLAERSGPTAGEAATDR
jgi:glycosyltransferase involved in cell wall biosynthesis